MKRFIQIGLVVLTVLVLMAGTVSAQRSTGITHPPVRHALGTTGGSGVTALLGYKAALIADGLYFPMGIGVSTKADRIYFIEEYANYIKCLLNGTEKSIGPFPYDLTCCRMRGSLYIGDEYGGIYKLSDKEKAILMGYDHYGDQVGAIDVDLPTGTVYFATNYWIDYDLTWTGLWKLPLSASPKEAILLDEWFDGPCFGLAVKGNKIYTTDYFNNSVWVCDKNANNWNEVISGFIGPTDMGFDKLGNMFVAEWDGGSVAAVKAGTTTIGRIAYGFSTPYYLQIDASNSIYLTDYYAEKIWKLSK